VRPDAALERSAQGHGAQAQDESVPLGKRLISDE
jgi:hypothetical protein